MLNNKTAFTLVEMIVAMAVSAIIIAATYASYDIVKTQYKKNLDVAEMHQSGRGIMQMIERDIRMAGFNYIDKDAKTTYGPISKPLIIKDSGNNCCDEVTVIYDYVEDVLDWKGKLVSSSVNRIRIHYWTEAYTSKKGDRYRLYKQKDILGKNNALLDKPINGIKEVMADFVEDFQIANIIITSGLFTGSYNGYLRSFDPVTKTWGLLESVKTKGGARIQATALAFGPDGLLYMGNAQGYLRSFDPVTKTWGIQEMSKTNNGQTISVSALAFKTKKTGQESLVTINLTLRTRNEYGKNKQFKKKDYHGGNFDFDKNDKYKRDTFSSSVLARNLML